MSCSGAIPRGGWLPAGFTPSLAGGCERELTPGKLGVRSARLLTLGPLTLARVWPLRLTSLSHTHTHMLIHPLMKPDSCLSGVLRALCTFTFRLIISDLIVGRNGGYM